MKRLIAVALMVAPGVPMASDPPIPLASGRYTFEHRYAEHPSIPGIRLTATLDGTHIVLENSRASEPFPTGVIAQGELMWHAASGQWIIGASTADRMAAEVGGCSDGPEVIDLSAKIYWTC